VRTRLFVCVVQSELQTLIGGAHQALDIEDLRRHTKYTLYKDSDRAIQWFWEVVEEMTPQQHRDLLVFATSCSRGPLLGFGKLHPPFTIQHVPNPDRVPQRCANVLISCYGGCAAWYVGTGVDCGNRMLACMHALLFQRNMLQHTEAPAVLFQGGTTQETAVQYQRWRRV